MTSRTSSRPSPGSRRLALGLVVVGGLLGMTGLVGMTGAGAVEQDRSQLASAERDQAAEKARAAGAPAVALCRSPSTVVPVLRAAGVCEAAESALSDPVVAGRTAPLSVAEVQAIVARVLPLAPSGVPLVPSVLDVLAGDPATSGLDEADTRAVVAAAVGTQDASDDPGPATEAPNPDGTGDQYSGVRFERDGDGACRGVTTYTRPDGSTREEASSAPDGSCAPAEPPPPTTASPPSTEPPPTSEAPETPGPSGSADPSVTDGPRTSQPDGLPGQS